MLVTAILTNRANTIRNMCYRTLTTQVITSDVDAMCLLTQIKAGRGLARPAQDVQPQPAVEASHFRR
jgi:hypothetical protein